MTLLLAHVALLWWLPFIPTQDGPAHMLHLVIHRDLRSGGTTWQGQFEEDFKLVPALGFYVPAYALVGVLGTFATERLMLSLYVLLMGVAVPAWLKAFGRPVFPSAHLVFPVMFGATFMLGFYNFIFGVPLLLLALSCAVRLRSGRPWVQAVAGNTAGVLLFFVHAIPWAVHALVWVLVLGWDAGGPRARLRSIGFRTLALLPQAALAVWFVLTARSPDQNPEWKPMAVLFSDFISLSGVTVSPLQGIGCMGGFFLAALAAGSGIRGNPLAVPFLIAGGVLTAVYFGAPGNFLDGSLFNIRLPWIILLILLPLLRRPRWGGIRQGFGVTVALAATINFGALAAGMKRDSEQVGAFVRGRVAGLPPGSGFFVARYDGDRRPPYPRHDPLGTAWAYYALDGAYPVGSWFEGRAKHRFIRALRQFPGSVTALAKRPREADWSRLLEVQYLLAWAPAEKDRLALQSEFTPLWEGDSPLVIWKRR